MKQIIDFCLKYGLPIATSILTGYLAAKWSVAKMKKEKLWEKKKDNYDKIINSIYDLLQYCEILKDDYGGGSRYSEDKMKELEKQYSEAYWNIKRLTTLGDYLVSKKASDVLIELRDRKRMEWDGNPPWEVWEEEYGHYKEALRKLIIEAKNDIKKIN